MGFIDCMNNIFENGYGYENYYDLSMYRHWYWYLPLCLLGIINVDLFFSSSYLVCWILWEVQGYWFLENGRWAWLTFEKIDLIKSKIFYYYF